jgi:ribosomal protein L16 Arg81 hydroxylase
MILDQLLGDVPRSEFLERYFHKLPFSRPGGCRHLADAAGWPLVEALLAAPGVDAAAVRDNELSPTLADPRRLLADGYTLRVRHAERHHPLLADIAADLRRAFAAPVDGHVYCTPAGHAGLGWHYDAEDVFVLQTAGSKEWALRKNTVNPWPLPDTIPADLRFGREIMPVMRCDLHAGDWLYVPAGYWHGTRAGTESVSLAVGVLSAGGLGGFDIQRPRLLDDLRWRQRLPTPGTASPHDDAGLLRQYRELFTDLGRDLADILGREETARAFVEARRSHQ